PVLGNGGIMTWQDAVEMVDQTGCHGVMLARGIFGNPWLIAQVKAAFEGRPIPAPPTPLEKWEVFHRYWLGMVEHRGARAILDIRKHLIWYSKGLRGSHDLRRELHEMTDEAKLLERTRTFFEQAHADELRHGAAPSAA
ncbi:MAG: tRNA-dihydrouridine synthase, partial [Deltaproteobacteria bacterium]|nr:tRNA-dihydrouridine synthase [Deltaproteobacteria bacterium]